MSSSVTELVRDPRVVQLEAALQDPSAWVRMGAAQALATSHPEHVAAALDRHWRRSEAAVSELAVIAWAYELAGVERLEDLASALEVNATRLSAILDLEPRDAFVYAVRDLPQLQPVEQILDEIWRTRLYRRHAADTPPEDERLPDRFENAVSAIESELAMGATYTEREALRTEGEQFFRAIREQLLSSDEEQQTSAIRRLAEVVMTEVNGWYREAASSALRRLGLDGSRWLLPSLAGSPIVTPTRRQLEGLAAGGAMQYDPAPDLDSGWLREIAAAYLSSTALQEFRDRDTVAALVDMALTGSLLARTRAELVLAGMPLDASLPHLFHEAVSRDDWDERERAVKIVDGIIEKAEPYAIHYHYVGLRKRINVSLEWFRELLAFHRKAPSRWTLDRAATVAILGDALRTLPLIKGEVTIYYADLPPWDKLLGFGRRAAILMRGHTKSPSSISRYPLVEFPSKCALQKPASLTIQLTIDPKEGSSPPLTFATDGAKEVRLLAVVRAPGFVIEPEYFQTFSVPIDASSPIVTFELTPVEPGPHTIEVSLFRDADRVGYYNLATEVVASGVAAESTQTTTLDSPTNRDLLRRGQTRAVILADWKEGAPIMFQLLDPYGAGVPVAIGESRNVIVRNDIEKWVKQQSAVIEAAVAENFETDEELKSVIANITAIGYSFFEEIGCPELAGVLAAFPEESIIAIESNESWIPWELLASSPSGPMWGEQFQIVRVPRFLDGDKTVVEAKHAPPPVVDATNRVERILAVVGDRITRDRSEGAYDSTETFGTKPPTLEELIESTSVTLEQKISAADIVHFTCHGVSEPAYHLSLGPGAARWLYIDGVRRLDLKPGALVFVNACSSDRARLLLTTFVSLGWNFYHQGARPFIGTLGPIPQRHAIAMAATFYRAFFIDGLPAGMALRRARRSVMQQLRNPFALFYCMYGPASVRRKL